MELARLSPLFFMFIILPSLIQLHSPTQADDDAKYLKCKSRFKCGKLNNIGYPFYDEEYQPEYCGYPGFKLYCSHDMPEFSMSYDNKDDPSGISINTSQNFYVLDYKNTSRTVSVVRADFYESESYCPNTETLNTSINFNLFSYTSRDTNVTLYYQCPSENNFSPSRYFSCPGDIYGYFVVPPNAPLPGPGPPCQRNFVVPIYQSAAGRITDNTSLHDAFQNGFELQWYAQNDLCDECVGSGGVCGSDPTLNKFTCYCADGPHTSSCPGQDTSKGKTPNSGQETAKVKIPNAGQVLTKSQIEIIASSSVGGIGMLVILIMLVICFKRRRSKMNRLAQPKTKQDVEALVRHHGIFGPKRYTSTDLKRITNSFKDKLGEGGYGTVYKGKLSNDQLVAVKVLKKANGDPAQFINEVMSIGMTNHKNIVTLLGICYEGNKLALVYDFMPNGSLDKFIGGGNSHQSLDWEKKFQIVIGIAKGLEYLHQGCNTRILHFDIKPHNILLDEDFCPKISDFGLAKSFPQKQSAISISGARGTVGYIAPEVFLKSFGGVSQKSDVYSYGMLVLEMVGCRTKSDVEFEYSSEEYFPQWIYKQLEQEEEIGRHEILTNVERELWRKMVIGSLWCIQTSPHSRPTITKVVEMLEGTSESLQVPPIPSLASPTRLLSQQNSSTAHTISIS